ncbi:ABC transporter substrate-binding protein [Streptomyces griseorubiginosus]|uniref:ABC transporter substrate-binding protein n=1 Tax=Streptomyces griseorubiginosus TaxID=67304 RepID=UPI0036753D4B
MPRSSASSAVSRRRFLAATGAVSLGAALSACGSGDAPDPSQPVSKAEIAAAMKEPTELTFWTWVPNIDKEVALFHAKYPAVKVEVVNVGQGVTHYTKLRTAIKAGKGAPDIAQIEYQAIPTFTITDSLLDLSLYGASWLEGKFVDWTWDQVSSPGGQVWAIPQDTGPMGLLYREDIFAEHDIQVPRTWDEFAEAARKLHRADPGVYLTNLAANEAAAWHGLLWQAGAKPYDLSGKRDIAINVDDSISRKLGAYWGGLAEEGVISADPDFTDSWYAGLNRGKYAAWVSAAWGPAFLSGSAKATSGKWRAAPLPQWDLTMPTSGNWGGSSSAVVKHTRNPIAAAQFAQFLNTDPASTAILATEQSLFPATNALLYEDAFIGATPSFYGGQKVNRVFADISTTISNTFQWPPFLDQAATDWTETVGKSFADRTDTGAALGAWQQRLATYARGQGFTVSS